MKIKNFEELAITRERKMALLIAEAGLEAVDTRQAIKNCVSADKFGLNIAGERFTKNKTGKLIVVGIGKCAIDAVEEIDNQWPENVDTAVAYDVRRPENPRAGINYLRGSHPFPTQENVESAKYLVGVLAELDERDIVVFVVSGGGSTLLCLPPKGRTWQDESNMLQELFKTGATIEEINAQRKRLSSLRGGGLAKLAYPARVISLIFSDVVGNNLPTISSGPTVLDDPAEQKYFEKVFNKIIVSNETALEAMTKKAKELNITVKTIESTAAGIARNFGYAVGESLHKTAAGCVHLYGGETTVKAIGGGKGGRNQEVALAALRGIKTGEIVLAIASDGRDNGRYAGAMADARIAERASERGLDAEKYLAENNSENFYEAAGDGHILTGPTGSNVADLTIALRL